MTVIWFATFPRAFAARSNYVSRRLIVDTSLPCLQTKGHEPLDIHMLIPIRPLRPRQRLITRPPQTRVLNHFGGSSGNRSFRRLCTASLRSRLGMLVLISEHLLSRARQRAVLALRKTGRTPKTFKHPPNSPNLLQTIPAILQWSTECNGRRDSGVPRGRPAASIAGDRASRYRKLAGRQSRVRRRDRGNGPAPARSGLHGAEKGKAEKSCDHFLQWAGHTSLPSRSRCLQRTKKPI